MTIKPIHDNILIAENKKTNTTSSGIIIESSTNHESKSATVIAIGENVTKVAVGDIIYPDWSNGHVIKNADVQRVVIKEEAVLAVVV